MTPYEIAKRWRGIREDSPEVAQIAAAYGAPFNFDDDAWCAVFVIACVRASGLNPQGLTPMARSTPDWLFGEEIEDWRELREGDIASFWRISPDRWEGHNGFVTRVSGDTITILGGNTSDAVRESDWSASRFVGGSRPMEMSMPEVNEGKEHYTRKAFFDAARKSPFGGSLTQAQVDGMEAFLTAWEPVPFFDRRWLAYCLATIKAETGTMKPREEVGKGDGKSYGVPDRETGHAYYGRGLVQLTWKANYEKATEEINSRDLVGRQVDLVNKPEQALEADIAAVVLIYGMAEGWFTNHSLPDYFNNDKSDWTGARKIVNGTDRANEIAGYAQAFNLALSLAATTAEPEQPDAAEPDPAVPESAAALADLLERARAMGGRIEIKILLD